MINKGYGVSCSYTILYLQLYYNYLHGILSAGMLQSVDMIVDAINKGIGSFFPAHHDNSSTQNFFIQVRFRNKLFKISSVLSK